MSGEKHPRTKKLVEHLNSTPHGWHKLTLACAKAPDWKESRVKIGDKWFRIAPAKFKGE